MKMSPIRIVLIDDHEMVRKGLRSFLGREKDLAIAGEAGTVAEGVTLVQRLRPQVVLLDARLPDASGMEACRRLLAAMPKLRIMFLTGYAEEATVMAALESGAHGYVLKDVRSEHLIHAIRAVAAGRGYLDPRIAQEAIRWIPTRPQKASAVHGSIALLSRQERLIMPLLAEGKTNKEIAAQLHLSDKTVKNYLANIFDKLNVNRRTAAVAWFVSERRSGFTPRGT